MEAQESSPQKELGVPDGGKEGTGAADDGKIKCPECGKLFMGKPAMVRHRTNQHFSDTVERFKCPIKGCKVGIEYLRRENVRSHIANVHKKDPYQYFPRYPNFPNKSSAPQVVDLSSESEEGNAPKKPKKTWKHPRHKCVVPRCKMHFSAISILRKHVRAFHKMDPVELKLYKQKSPWLNGEDDNISEENSESDDDDGKFSTKEASSKGESSDENKVEEAAVCSLCCSSFFSSSKQNEEFGSGRELKEFVKKLAEKQSAYRKSYLNRVNRLKFCPNCCRVTKAGVDKHVVVNKVESELVTLQQKAQKRVKRLQKRMIEYSAEIRKMEEKVNGRDDSCLKERLEKNTTRVDYNKLVTLLREGIVATENNIQVYYGHVQGTICDDKLKVDTSDESEQSSDDGRDNRKSYGNSYNDRTSPENVNMKASAGSVSDSGSGNYRSESEQDSEDNYQSSGDSSEENYSRRRRRSGRNRGGSSRKVMNEDSDDSRVKKTRNSRKRKKIVYKEANSDDTFSDAKSESE